MREGLNAVCVTICRSGIFSQGLLLLEMDNPTIHRVLKTVAGTHYRTITKALADSDYRQFLPQLEITGLVMVHGKPRHPQSQGSVERANGDIKDMLVAWMGDNDTNDWSVGIKLVQFQKNSSYHSGIQRSPYAAMFGCEAKVGLTSSSLPTEVVVRMQSEDDLISAISNVPIVLEHTAADIHESVPSTSQRDNVAVPIPLVDRGRGDPRNILGIIIDRDENDMYAICVKAGILKGKFTV
ncbi:SCAN domain-containing protein 3-like [Gigantopelta aegis]|uniref:SCAN domain-containing protein 3-like n=1 Tax=Gigantopelta aegis TaxID=1735272 RepID=UPI001B8892B6|nr:SCAN domain-containing protein 3-like [Gigantopelta aegis]